MKNILKILVTVTLIALSFCKPERNGMVKEIQVFNSPTSGDLSTLIKSYEIIPLDNRPEAYINNPSRIIFTDSLILFKNESNQNIIIFNKTGKYKKSISKKGRGPGEYLYISDFTFNPSERIISIVDNNKIKKYNLDGDFIEEVNLGFRPNKATRLASGLTIFEKTMPSNDQETDFYIRLVDKNYHTIASRLPIKPLKGPGFGTEGQTFRTLINNDHAFFFSYSGDTVYHIDNKSIKPVYSFKYSKNIITVTNGTGAYDIDPNEAYRYLSYFEIGDLNLLYFSYKNTPYCFLFNASDSSSKLYKSTFMIRDVADNKGIMVINSMSLSKFIESNDPEKRKCINLDTLDKALKEYTNDFNCIFRIEFANL